MFHGLFVSETTKHFVEGGMQIFDNIWKCPTLVNEMFRCFVVKETTKHFVEGGMEFFFKFVENTPP